MSKTFEKRVSKKNRKVITLNEELFKNFGDELFEGAKLQEVNLKSIVVKDQVRTKFNEASIRELAANIEANGLIQPLVVHRENNKFVLICGERRYRAMTSIDIEAAPCFVLENKSTDELMAIQFSENSSREALHYVDKADGILNYQNATKSSERKICKVLGISKTEVHRSLIIAKLPKKVKEAAKNFDIEKYVLIEFNGIENNNFKKTIERQILLGTVRKRLELRKLIKDGGIVGAKKISTRSKKQSSLPVGMSANAFLKVMKNQVKDLDPAARKAFNDLIKQAENVVK